MIPKLIHTFYRAYWQLVRPVTLGARILLVQGGEVVLVKHSYSERWYLPGGGVKPGEGFAQAARREASEEVGATVHEMQLLGLYHSLLEGKSDHIAVFVSESYTLEETSDIEIAEVRRFPLTNMPQNLSPATGRRIQEFQSGQVRAQVSCW